MSHQLCQNCGSNQFEHIDGRLYCVVCQSQNISLQIHVSFANEGSAQLGRRVRDQTHTTELDETIPKIEIYEANETIPYSLNRTEETIAGINELTVDDNEQSLTEQHIWWSTYEVYSYILHLQIQSIIELYPIKPEKQNEIFDCTFMLYLRYLSANGVLDTNEQRILKRQEEKRLKTNLLSKLTHTTQHDLFDRPKVHVQNRHLCLLNLDILLGLIHCACTLINCPITIHQLINWINTDRLPYYHIKKYLPSWMNATGRDRFNLEKMNIHSGNFFFYYNTNIQPVIKPYLSRCIFSSSSYLYDILLRLCEIYCQQIYFPFDQHTRMYFQSICQIIVRTKSTGRRFLSTSIDLELSALVMIILLLLLRSINDHLLDRFIQENFPETNFFSYSLWLKTLNELISIQSIRYYQFYGRTSVLIDAKTDNQSKIRYMQSLSKIFTDNLQTINTDINTRENHLQQILINNCKSGSLIYAIHSKQFFLEHFQTIPSDSLPFFFENLVHRYSPREFSLVDKSELYETLLSLIHGTTIDQIKLFYVLHQRFDWASSTNFHFNQLISTLTKFSSIPYDQEFYSYLSRFFKTFAFPSENLHHYFYQSTLFKRLNLRDGSECPGMKQYGIDQLPIVYDLKSEQKRSLADV